MSEPELIPHVVAELPEVVDRTAFTYSVVIPGYKSEAIVGDTVHRVVEVFEEAGLQYEVVLVNDGSPDRSWAVISELARTTPQDFLVSSQPLRIRPIVPTYIGRADAK